MSSIKSIEVLITPVVAAAVKRRDEMVRGTPDDRTDYEKWVVEWEDVNMTIASAMSCQIRHEFDVNGWEL